MRALSYLFSRTIVNHVKQLFRKPLILLLYLLFIGFLVFTLYISSNNISREASNAIAGYSAILTGAFLAIGGLTVWSGLKQGASLFTMADVNLLFTSPVSPRSSLLMGVTRQAGIMLLASVFMLFQYPNMRLNGLGVEALIGLVFAYALMGICSGILSAVIYARCAGSITRKKRVNDIMAGVFALILVGAVVAAIRSESALSGAISYFGASVWEYLPFFGWARGLAVAFALNDWGRAALFFALELLGIGACILTLLRSDMDYFEDVLFATERLTQIRENAKEGRMVEQGDVLRKIKREGGPLWGKGSLVFAGRIFREQSRRGIYLLDMATLGATAGPLMGLMFMDQEVMEVTGLWAIFGMTLWMLVFLQLTTSIAREFTYPLVYLAPRSAFSKLVAILFPGLIKAMVDAVVFAACLMLLFKATITDAILGWIVYVSIITLYSSGLLIVERLLGAARNRMLIMLVYVFLLLFLCVPGIVVATLITDNMQLGYLLFALWNVLVSAIVIFFCRNVLHSMES